MASCPGEWRLPPSSVQEGSSGCLLSFLLLFLLPVRIMG